MSKPSGKLRRVAPPLRKLGFVIDLDARTPDRERSRDITISGPHESNGKTASAASGVPARGPSLEGTSENRADASGRFADASSRFADATNVPAKQASLEGKPPIADAADTTDASSLTLAHGEKGRILASDKLQPEPRDFAARQAWRSDDDHTEGDT